MTTNQEQPVTVAVLGNDIDPLGRGLRVVVVSAVDAGTASTDGAQVTFSPAPGFFGSTAFTYCVRDGANVASRRVRGPGRRHGDRHAVGAGLADRRRRQRHGHRQLGGAASNGAPIDQYEIRIGEGEARTVGNQTGYTWSGLTNGEGVSFNVRAHNTAGWGPWSAPSPVVTPDIEPGRPAAPTVQFADGALIVSWSPPANEGSAITAYDLQIGGGASAVQRVGTATTFRWEGLQNGQEYTFMVRAVNAKGEGQFSSPSAPEHPLRQPDAPAAPVGQRGDKFINVNWTPPANGGDPIIEYEVQLQSTGAVARATGTSLRWSNLPNGQAQSFLVRARNRGGWGASRHRRRPSCRAVCPTRRAASAPSAATARRPCRGRRPTTRAAPSAATP